MSIIRKAPYYVGALVLILGLASCGSKNSENPTAAIKKSSWRLNEPLVRRQGQPDLRFKDVDRYGNQFALTDQLIFKEADEVSLKISTICKVQGEALPAHEQVKKLKSSFYLFELMPQSALFNSQNTQASTVECEMKFVARNSSGSTHEFFLPATAISILTNSEALLPIQADGHPLALSDQLPELSLENIRDYSITADRQDIENYALRCEYSKADLKATTGELYFDEFRRVATDEETKNRVHSTQYCRLFGMGENSSVLALTGLFILRAKWPRLNVQRVSPVVSLTPPHRSYSQGILVGKFELINRENSDVPVSLPVGNKQSMKVQLLARHMFNGKFYYREAAIPLKATLHGATATVDNDEVRFVVPANRTVEVSIDLNLKDIRCSHPYVGFYQEGVAQGDLSLTVFEKGFDFSTEPEQKDIVGNLVFESNHRVWREPECDDVNCKPKQGLLKGPPPEVKHARVCHYF